MPRMPITTRSGRSTAQRASKAAAPRSQARRASREADDDHEDTAKAMKLLLGRIKDEDHHKALDALNAVQKHQTLSPRSRATLKASSYALNAIVDEVTPVERQTAQFRVFLDRLVASKNVADDMRVLIKKHFGKRGAAIDEVALWLFNTRHMYEVLLEAKYLYSQNVNSFVAMALSHLTDIAQGKKFLIVVDDATKDILPKLKVTKCVMRNGTVYFRRVGDSTR